MNVERYKTQLEKLSREERAELAFFLSSQEPEEEGVALRPAPSDFWCCAKALRAATAGRAVTDSTALIREDRDRNHRMPDSRRTGSVTPPLPPGAIVARLQDLQLHSAKSQARGLALLEIVGDLVLGGGPVGIACIFTSGKLEHSAAGAQVDQLPAMISFLALPGLPDLLIPGGDARDAAAADHSGLVEGAVAVHIPETELPRKVDIAEFTDGPVRLRSPQ